MHEFSQHNLRTPPSVLQSELVERGGQMHSAECQRCGCRRCLRVVVRGWSCRGGCVRLWVFPFRLIFRGGDAGRS
jgi:hypothetical protein